MRYVLTLDETFSLVSSFPSWRTLLTNFFPEGRCSFSKQECAHNGLAGFLGVPTQTHLLLRKTSSRLFVCIYFSRQNRLENRTVKYLYNGRLYFRGKFLFILESRGHEQRRQQNQCNCPKNKSPWLFISIPAAFPTNQGASPLLLPERGDGAAII